MTTFSYITAIASLVIFAGFVAYSVFSFGWPSSYSSFAKKWIERLPMHNVNLWSIVTAVVAFLLFPAMIERGEGNLLQCLGFFAPLYLLVVAFTPKWETEHKQYVIHCVGTALCAAAALAWLIVIRHLWWVLLIALGVMAAAAFLTKTFKASWFFWLEMAFFGAAYAATIIPFANA